MTDRESKEKGPYSQNTRGLGQSWFSRWRWGPKATIPDTVPHLSPQESQTRGHYSCCFMKAADLSGETEQTPWLLITSRSGCKRSTFQITPRVYSTQQDCKSFSCSSSGVLRHNISSVKAFVVLQIHFQWKGGN